MEEINSENEDRKPLTNEDFRVLLMTPRHNSNDNQSSKSKSSVSFKGKKKNQNSSSDIKKSSSIPQTPLKGQGKYRDRAAERRMGITSDYENGIEATEDLLKSFQVVPTSVASDPLSREEIIEKSKFLGGDLEHTHLVKGLDYTLRNKVLKELESEEVQLPQAPQPPPQPKPVSSSNTTKHLFTKKALLKLREQENLNEEEEQKKIEEKKEKIVKEEEKEEEDESNPTQSKRKPKFKTHIAKSVYYTLFLSSIPESTEAFLPGRTCLIFNLVSKNEPDIIMRSAEKFSPLKQPIVDPLDDLLIEKIKDTIHNPPQKKPKVQPQPQLVKKSNSEEDIFADAGDYIPTNSTSQVKPKLIQSYFDVKFYLSDQWKLTNFYKKKPEKLEPMETYISELPVGLQRQLESAKKYVSIHGTDQAETEIEETTLSLHELRQKELTSKKRKARPQDISVDSYSECFPGTYEGNFAEYEDEEDDISKMDMGGKNKLHRRDFTSQEAWSSYNDNREALPRAAFQFGVKMNDGRKTKKNTEKTKEKKLEKELKKINTIIKEKENARHTQVPTAEEARKRLKLT